MKKEEDEVNDTSTGACLSSETQSFELEFIKTYERWPILWDAKHPDYTNKYRRCIATDALLKIMKKWDSTATQRNVRQKINILRSCYRKDLRKHLASKTIGPNGEEIYEYIPKNWKFRLLRFLGGKIDEGAEQIKNNSIVEINLDETNFEDEASEGSEIEENPPFAGEDLQTFSEDNIYKHSHTNEERRKKKRMKLEVQEGYFIDDNTLDKEFEAIGSNVACKLKRMNSVQRCHAELLINKVLIEGVKNKLTDDTDLTEVYK